MGNNLFWVPREAEPELLMLTKEENISLTTVYLETFQPKVSLVCTLNQKMNGSQNIQQENEFITFSSCFRGLAEEIQNPFNSGIRVFP